MMMAFRTMMPISEMMPSMAVTDKSSPKSHSPKVAPKMHNTDTEIDRNEMPIFW